MMADPDIRNRLTAAADGLHVDPERWLSAFHQVQSRREAIRRVTTIVTALALAAIAFALVWIAVPFGARDHEPASSTGATGPGEPVGTIAYMVVLDNGERSTVALSPVSGPGRTQPPLPEAFAAYPVFSPDGSRLAYLAGDDYGSLGLAVADAGGGDPHVVAGKVLGSGFAWSPDGTRLAYVGVEHEGGLEAIRVVRADGSDDHAVLPGNVWQSVSWSPDGTRLLVVGHPSSPDNVGGPEGWDAYTVAVDGSNLQPLTATTAFEHAASWSPDGTQILFTRSDDSDDADYDQDIWVMDADGSNERRLTDWRGFDAFPAWSPDGLWIVFASDRDATPEQQRGFRNGDTAEGISLYVMRADGTEVRRAVTAGEGEALLPASWRVP